MTAVVLGDLHIIRCLGMEGIPVIAVTPIEYVRFSRYCKKYITCPDPYCAPEAVLDILINLGRNLKDKTPIFYNGDHDVLLVSRYRNVLSEHYLFNLSDEEVIEAFLNKEKFINLALSKDIPIPETIIVNSLEDIYEVDQKIGFPCIAKPFIQKQWLRRKELKDVIKGPRKSVKFEKIQELQEFYNRVKSLTEKFIIQRWIEGDDSELFSFHVYYNKDAQPVAYYAGRKIRTYPPDSGISTFLELVDEPRIVKLGLSILNKFNFKGVAKIDFKRDIFTDKFYVLEINPRFNLWNYLGACSGINIPAIAYHDLFDRSYNRSSSIRKKYRWLWFDGDLSAIREYRRIGRWSYWQWILSLINCKKVYKIFSWKDPFPFLFHSLKEFSRRILKRLFSR